GRSAGYDRFEALAVSDTTAILVGINKFFNGKPQLDFVDSRFPYISTSRNQLGPCASFDTNLRIFLTTVVNDRHGSRDRLHIVHYRRTVVQTRYRWERRFYPRI